jgi:hypothetical protein
MQSQWSGGFPQAHSAAEVKLGLLLHQLRYELWSRGMAFVALSPGGFLPRRTPAALPMAQALLGIIQVL